jgi:hypothetical protein
MQDDLRTAYSMKERAERLLSNLDKLKAERTITDTEYETLKPEYAAMLDDALSWIDSKKNALKKELDVKEKELEREEKQLSLLRARKKVGEITAETYREKGKPLEERVKDLQSHISELEAIINCSSSSDIGGPKDISMPIPVAEAKWKRYLNHFVGAVSRLISWLSKRVKVGKPILVSTIIVGVIALIVGLVIGTSKPHIAEIAFLSGTTNETSVRIIDANGSNERVITDNPSLHYNPPVWSPDGKKITSYYWPDALTSEDLSWGVLIMDKYGKNQKKVVLGDAMCAS